MDIGASIGVFSIYASQKVGKNGRVISFEPEATSHNALLGNINANNVTNVKPMKMGVWDSHGTQKIKADKANLGASTMFSGEGESVEVDTLPAILKGLGITHVDFVKMDTEGAATRILKGCSGWLQNVDNFAIAAYHVPYENPLELSKILRDAGFRTKIISRYGTIPFVYATRDATINLVTVELWQVLVFGGVAGLLAYQLVKKR